MLTELPLRQGDAMALAASDRYWDVIERARPHAARPSAGYLDELVAHHDAVLPTEAAPGKPIESLALHHDACSRS